MKSVAIIGGKLQGIEAAYLAQKAGIRSLLIDKDPEAPAKNLCDDFFCCDVTKKEKQLIDALKAVDFILPANENEVLLSTIVSIAKEHDLILAFDPDAYAVSSSKLRSDQLFHENGIPSPRYYPEGKAPYIVKPSGESGSTGVTRFDSEEALLHAFPDADSGRLVIQEYLTGPSYSIEVIGTPGNYRTYQVTEIHMAEDYDCKKVTAPCAISAKQKKEFGRLAQKLAELLCLHGIMDIEVIDDGEAFKVLEIDARIPSQTPTVVYHSTGMNFVSELHDLFCEGTFRKPYDGKERFCSFEHYLFEPADGQTAGAYQFTEHGEHIMSQGGPLSLRSDYLGADEVLSDIPDGPADRFLPEAAEKGRVFRGTFINTADSEEELERKRRNMLSELTRWCLQG